MSINFSWWNEIFSLLRASPLIYFNLITLTLINDWNGKKEFLIDCACFPGSSGSPVLLFNVGGYFSRKGMNLGGMRLKLLGILYAGPQHTATGEIEIVNVPVKQQPVAISRIPSNLGIVIKSEKLLDFENIFN